MELKIKHIKQDNNNFKRYDQESHRLVKTHDLIIQMGFAEYRRLRNPLKIKIHCAKGARRVTRYYVNVWYNMQNDWGDQLGSYSSNCEIDAVMGALKNAGLEIIYDSISSNYLYYISKAVALKSFCIDFNDLSMCDYWTTIDN